MTLTAGPAGALRDFKNAALGRAGEEWVLDLERERLDRSGRRDLSDLVSWVARDIGDGLGYDIGSFRPSGDLLKVEVKTTNLGPRTPFYITRWEVEVSETSAALVAGEENWTTALMGTTDSWQDIRSRTVVSGRFFDDETDDSAAVVVIGADTATELFGTTNVIGDTVSFDGTQLEIIGVLETPCRAPRGGRPLRRALLDAVRAARRWR